ncbi:MAG: biotin synthase BioB [Candidatus Saganbacteria bacterium]|nr:biotin synthase BioB [Candidatus Saganbacteria bacterium]
MEISSVSSLIDMPLTQIISLADKVRSDNMGNCLDVCTITNAKSGLCGEDCKFCAQSSHHNAEIEVYGLKSKEKMFSEAVEAKKNGAKRFGIVTSGNNLTEEELGVIERAIRDISVNVGIIACASLGALTESQLLRLKRAGLSRYHHNIETSRNFYPKIVSTHSFDERIDTIKAAKKVGLQVCSGGIIGLGEGWQDRIDMALLLKELNVDSVPINILVPIKGTPMEGKTYITPVDAVRTIAMFRIILKDKTIKVAAGRETILKDYQAMAFMAGANGMLIGGYLTVRGRGVEEDQKFIKEIIKMWENDKTNV